MVVEAAQVGRRVPVAGAAAGERPGGVVGVDERVGSAQPAGDLVAQPGDEQVGLVAGALRRAVHVAVAHQVGQAPTDVGQRPAGVEDVDAALIGLPGQQFDGGVEHGRRRLDA